MCLGVGLVLAGGCRRSAPAAPPELLFGWHSVGTAHLDNDTNTARLREIWSLPASVELRDQTLQKLARAPLDFLAGGAALAEEQRTALVKPLLDDLLQSESFAEARARSNQPPACALAIRLDDARASVWRTHLHELVTGQKADAALTGDWLDSRPGALGGTNQVGFARVGEWVVVRFGQAGSPNIHQDLLHRIKTSGRPAPVATNYYLQAEVNLPSLAERGALAKTVAWPAAQLTLVGKEDHLRTNLRLRYPRAQNWALEPWNVPTNIMHDPPRNQMTSLLAARGFGPWLSRQPVANELELKSAPDQFFLWSQSVIAFQTFAALPVGNAADLLTRLREWLPANIPTRLLQSGLVKVIWATNRSRIEFLGLPIMFPYIEAAPGTNGTFLAAGLLPLPRNTNPPPTELLAELTGQTNLLFYEWEVSEARLLHWRVLSQIASILAGQRPATTNRLSQRWIEAIAPKLENSVTQITVSSPQELNLVRKSHLGCSSLELLALAYWLDDPEFPKWQIPDVFRPPPPGSHPRPVPPVGAPGGSAK